MKKQTICDICEKFKIKDFDTIYNKFKQLNINPLDIKMKDLQILFELENKQISLDKLELNDLEITNKSKKNFTFMGKSIRFKEKTIDDKYIKIIEDLNKYRVETFNLPMKKLTDKHIKLIDILLNKKFTIEDFFKVHEYVANLYKNSKSKDLELTKKLNSGFYYTPETLYNSNKFEKRVEDLNNGVLNIFKNIKDQIDTQNKDIEIILNLFNKGYFLFFNKEYNFNDNLNKETIRVKLEEGFVVNDFLLVLNYFANQCLNTTNNLKLREGLYFRPQTICNNKFSSRLSNAKQEIENGELKIRLTIDSDKLEEEKEDNQDIINNVLKRLNS